MKVAVTGGAGYIGACLVETLLGRHQVVVIDVLLHGQADVAGHLEAAGARFVQGDIGDPDLLTEALQDVDAVVHLAAIVGDPACARDAQAATRVNLDGSRSVLRAAQQAGASRFVFASTCSNYGRMADPTVPIDEDAPLRPVSLYAEQKVAVEQELLSGAAAPLSATCLRFATVYGLAPRMRFDLTVNEFTRDLWAERKLDVFGEQFWRPYVHVRDAASAISLVLAADEALVGGRVFNVGESSENYRKLDLVELITSHLGRGEVSYVHRDEDPRDYKVSFDRIRNEVGFVPERRVPDGIAEVSAALDSGSFEDPFDPRYRN